MASSKFDRLDSWDKKKQIDSPFQDETFFSEEEADYAARGMKNLLVDYKDESPFLQAFVGGESEAGLSQREEPDSLYNSQEEFEEPELEEPYQPEVENEQSEFSSAEQRGHEDQQEHWNEYDAPVDGEDEEQVNDEADYYADEQNKSERQVDWGREGEQDWEDEDDGEFSDATEEPVYEEAEFDVVDNQEQDTAFEDESENEYGLERILPEHELNGLIAQETGINLNDPRIDVRAKFALSRMLKRADSKADAARLVQGINSGQLAGIYGDDLRAAVNVARKHNTQRWLLVPKGEDAVLVLEPVNSLTAPPTVIFRGDTPDISKQSERFYAALSNASQTFNLFLLHKLVFCKDGGISVNNLFSSVYCRVSEKKELPIPICSDRFNDIIELKNWAKKSLNKILDSKFQINNKIKSPEIESINLRDSIKFFQKKVKLPVTGILEKRTCLSLKKHANIPLRCIINTPLPILSLYQSIDSDPKQTEIFRKCAAEYGNKIKAIGNPQKYDCAPTIGATWYRSGNDIIDAITNARNCINEKIYRIHVFGHSGPHGIYGAITGLGFKLGLYVNYGIDSDISWALGGKKIRDLPVQDLANNVVFYLHGCNAAMDCHGTEPCTPHSCPCFWGRGDSFAKCLASYLRSNGLSEAKVFAHEGSVNFGENLNWREFPSEQRHPKLGDIAGNYFCR